MLKITQFEFVRDLKAVLKLEAKTFGRDAFPLIEFIYLYKKGARTFLVAYEGNQLTGYVSAYIEGNTGYIASLAVDEEFRKRGIGRQLMQAVMVIIRQDSHIQSIQLHVRESNHSAITLYQSIGYKVIATEPAYYGDEDGLVMGLIIPPNQEVT